MPHGANPMADDNTRVSFVIDEKKRDEWKEYANDNTEYASLSDLIRTSVAHEMAGAHKGNGAATDELAIQLGEVLDRMDEMSDRIHGLQADVSEIKGEEGKEPEIGKLATEVFKVLPDEEPGTIEWRAEKNDRDQARGKDAEAENRYQSWLGTPNGLAEALNEPEYRIRDAIEKLLTDTHTVREAELHGEERYYREG